MLYMRENSLKGKNSNKDNLVSVQTSVNIDHISTLSIIKMAAESLKLDKALSYMGKIEDIFVNRESKYWQPEVKTKFMEMIKEFKLERITRHDVIVRMSQLFNGHTELILGFNCFLPEGYKLEVINVMMQGTGKNGMQTILKKPDGSVEMTALHPLDSLPEPKFLSGLKK